MLIFSPKLSAAHKVFIAEGLSCVKKHGIVVK